MFRLDGRVALVTGSTTGLGKAIAFGLADAGCQVAINFAHQQERADRTWQEFDQQGRRGCLVRGSVLDEREVDRIFTTVEEQCGPVDIVVVNATPDQPLLPIEQYDWEFHQLMLDYFVRSPYLLARRALPHMKFQRWGRLVNITSEVFQCSVAHYSAYVAAKGGQIGWSRSLATELAPFGITVNMVAPGWIPLERHDKDPAEMKDAYLAAIPMRRWGVPQDVAHAVHYFASEEASFVTGQTLCVNGGRSPW